MDVRVSQGTNKRGGDGGEQQENLVVNILLERGESNKTTTSVFILEWSWHYGQCDRLWGIHPDFTWGLLFLSLAALLFLWQRVTFLGSILPSLLLLKVFQWLFLILGFRQKSYAGFGPIFLVNLILQLPNGLPVHASTSRVPRQSLGMCWSIVLVLALFFSESDTLSLGVRHWLNKAAS